MKSLVFWGEGHPERARRRQAEGATLLLWHPEREESLRAAGVPFEAATARLPPQLEEWVEGAVEAWAQAWPHVSLLDGHAFAERVQWKGESLGWCAEGFLRGSQTSAACVRLIETFRLLLEAEAPDEVEAVGLVREQCVLLDRLCTGLKILYHGPGGSLDTSPSAFRVAIRRVRGTLELRRTAAPRGPGPPPVRGGASAGPAPVLWLVDEEPGAADPAQPYLRPDLDRHARRTVRREVRRASLLFGDEWRRLRASPGLHEAFRHRGVDFADLGAGDLAELMLFALPRAVRRYEQVAAAISAQEPRMAMLRHEDRAAQSACRAAAIPFAFFRGFKPPAGAPAEPGPAA